MVISFQRRKNDTLARLDKSSKKSWDEKIAGLCEKINSLENYYTTSSCSGRILLMISLEKKQKDLFLKVYHDLVSVEKLKKELNNLKNKELIKFKSEPCILHVACKNLESCQKMHDAAKNSGWKHCGIIATGRRFVVELSSSEKLEFPIMKNGKILVDDDFLKIVLKQANENLEKSWEKIEQMKKSI